MSGVKLSIKGADQVQKALKDIGQAFNDKVLYDVHNAAGSIAKNQLKNDAASHEGNNDKPSRLKLSENVKKVRSRIDKNGVWVGFSKRVFYALFLEKGTQQRRTKGRKPANRGR